MPRRDQIEELLKSDPDDLFLLYALAMAYISEGDTEEGLNRLDDVIERDPNYVAAYFQKGQTLAGEGNTSDAKLAITQGIDVARKIQDSHAEGEMSAFLESLA